MKQRRKPFNDPDPDSNSKPSYYSTLSYAKVERLSKIALPLTLNEYYLPFIENVKDCLLFLERFSDEDETIAKLLETYNNPKLFKKNSDSLDLDKLAEKAGLSKGEFRRLINSTLDLLGDEEAMMLLRLNKRHLVKKSIEIALTDPHPDSFEERKALMQFYGIHPIPKNASVQVNIDKSQNLSLSQTQVGLPSFASTISESEKVASQQIKALIEESDATPLDADFTSSPKLALVKAPSGEGNQDHQVPVTVEGEEDNE